MKSKKLIIYIFKYKRIYILMLNLTLDECVETASKSSLISQFSATIMYRNKVIATGYNRVTKISSLNNQCLLCT
jgi:deoxycytidylate deaminase